MGVVPPMDWATPMRPALVPTRGRQRDGPGQSNPPLPRPSGPPNRAPEGGWHTDAPPPPKTDPTAASQAAPGALGCQTVPAKHAAGGDARRLAACPGGSWARTFKPPPRGRRGTGPGDQRLAARNHGATPPPSPPSPPPTPARRMLETGQGGACPLPPPPRQGRFPPPPPKRAAAPGGEHR